jgi:hypothetical protein
MIRSRRPSRCARTVIAKRIMASRGITSLLDTSGESRITLVKTVW